MIAPDDFQTAIVALLRADTALAAAVNGGATGGIHEESWKGTAFAYPCVRVGRPTLGPLGRGPCSDRDSAVTWSVTAFSVKDSSITAQTLQGLILDALTEASLDVATFSSTPIHPTLSLGAEPTGPNEAWKGEVQFRTIVKQK